MVGKCFIEQDMVGVGSLPSSSWPLSVQAEAVPGEYSVVTGAALEQVGSLMKDSTNRY